MSAIYHELSTNLKDLETDLPYHEGLRNMIGELNDSIRRGLIQVGNQHAMRMMTERISRNAQVLGSAQIRNVSWQTFKATEAYVLLDYELASTLSEQYQMQEEGIKTTREKLQELFLSGYLFQPEETEIRLIQVYWNFRELAGQEQYLIKLTRHTLSALEEAYPEWIFPSTEAKK